MVDDDDAGHAESLTYKLMQENSPFSIDGLGRIRVKDEGLVNFERQSQYELTVKAIDVGQSQVTGTVMVYIVNENEAPEVQNHIFTVEENVQVKFDIGPLEARDPDGHAVVLSIVSGNDADIFKLQGSRLQVKTNILNFEEKSSYILQMQATDADTIGPAFGSHSSLSTPFSATIIVLDVNEKPVITSGQTFSVFENSIPGKEIGLPIVAADPDTNQILSYTIESGNEDNQFEIEGCSGQLLVGPGLKHSAMGCFGPTQSMDVIRLHGPFLNPTDIMSTCTSHCSDYEFFGIRNGNICYCANNISRSFGSSLGNTECPLSCTKGGIESGKRCGGPDSFSVYRIYSGLDFETTTSYSIEVKVIDNGQPMMTSTEVVTITVEDVNEAPELWASSKVVPEDTGLNEVVGEVAEVEDPDSASTANFSIYDCCVSPCPFCLPSSASSSIETCGALDFESQPSCAIVLQVVDNGGLIRRARVTLSVSDVNEPPVLESADFSVHENSAPGFLIGSPLLAWDPDIGQTIAFSIVEGPSSNCFYMDAGRGQMSVLDASCLNYENIKFDTWTDSESSVKSISEVDEGDTYCVIDKVEFLSQDEDDMELKVSFSLEIVDYLTSLEDEYTEALKDATLRLKPGDDLYESSERTITDVGCTNDFDLCGTLQFKVPLLRATTTVEFKFNDFNYATIFDVADLKKSFTLSVEATDSSVAKLSTTNQVNIAVLDVNEAPIFTSIPTLSIKENSIVGSDIGDVLTDNLVDPEGGEVTFSIASQSIPGALRIHGVSGQLQVGVMKAFNYEIVKSIEVEVLVSNEDVFTRQNLVVTIVDVEEAPTVHCISIELFENIALEALVGDPVAVDDEDVDDDTFTFSIQENAFFGIQSTSGQMYVKGVLDYEKEQDYSLKVSAKDDADQVGSCVMTINVLDVNESPYGAATYARAVPENAAVGFKVLFPEVIDPERAVMTYALASNNGLFVVDTSTGLVTVNTAGTMDFENVSSYKLFLSATDSVHTFEYECDVTVIDSNEAPLCPINAAEFDVTENSRNEVLGNVLATDPENKIIKYQLLLDTLNGPQYANFFSISEEGKVSVTSNAELDFEDKETFTLSYIASDDVNLSVVCTFTVVVVNVNESPVCADLEISIEEKQRYRVSKILTTITAVDPEGHAVTFYLDETFDGRFHIDASSGQLSIPDMSTINYEEKNSYELNLRVKDTELEGTCKVSLQIIDMNDCPVWIRPRHNPTVSVNENAVVGSLVGSPFRALDEDVLGVTTGRLTYSIGFSSIGGALTLNTLTGELRVGALLNHENTDKGVLVLYVTDDFTTPCSTPMRVDVLILNVNERPVVESEQSATVKEHSPMTLLNIAIPILNVKATDPDVGEVLKYTLQGGLQFKMFRVDSTNGDLYVRQPNLFNYEEVQFISLAVSVVDRGGLQSVAKVGITVVDVNERPTFNIPAVVTVVENAQVGDKVLPTLMDLVTDPDNGGTLEFSASLTGSPFSLSTDGVLKVVQATIDYETQDLYSYPITVCDNGLLCSTSVVDIQIMDINESPVMSNTVSVSVEENSPMGHLIGDPLPASDPDLGQTIEFKIVSGNEDGIFGIFSCSGQLYLKQSRTLNFELKNEYEITVEISDDAEVPMSIERDVKINVLDINESPVLCFTPTLTVSTFMVSSASPVSLAARIALASQPEGYCSTSITSTELIRNTNVCDGLTSTTPSLANIGMKIDVAFLTGSTELFAVRIIGTSTFGLSVSLDGIFKTINKFSNGARNVYQTEESYTLIAGKHRLVMYTADPVDDGYLIEIKHGSDPWEVISTTSLNALRPQTTSMSILENSPLNTPLGILASAVDEDGGQTLLYTIELQDSSLPWGIDSSTGNLFVANPSVLNFEDMDKHTVLIRVEDSGTPLLFDTCLLEVILLDKNEPPVLKTKIINVKENLEAETPFTPFGSLLVATDPDFGDTATITFEMVQSTGVQLFGITPSGQMYMTAGTELDHEEIESYTVMIRVRDATLFSDAKVIIQITDVDEPPVILDVPEGEIDENSVTGTPVFEVSAYDPEERTLEFSIINGPIVDGKGYIFRMVPKTHNSAQLEVAQNVLNFEVKQSYTFTIKVTDDEGPGVSMSSQVEVTVDVNDVNEPPLYIGTKAMEIHVNENTHKGTTFGDPLTNFFSDPDAGDTLTFEVISSFPSNNAMSVSTDHRLMVVKENEMDHETIPIFKVAIKVTDSEDHVLFYEAIVVVDDVNEAPYFTSEDIVIFISEKALEDKDLPPPVIYHFDAIDPEGKSDELRYEIVSQGSNHFTMDYKNGNLILQSFFTTAQYDIRIRVLDKNGDPDGKVNELDIVAQIHIIDHVNEVPQLPDTIFSISENSKAGTIIGALIGKDKDVGTILSFSIPETLAQFSIQSIGDRTAQLTLTAGVSLDFETRSQYIMKVCVTDDGAAHNGIGVLQKCSENTINVINVNEAPIIDKASCKTRSVVESTSFQGK